MTATTPNAEQIAAIEETGVVFVSAGAGTGKTTVLVERFVKAVCERGLSIDSVLVITYTERAAGELRSRIRDRLVELERHDLAREIDRAWSRPSTASAPVSSETIRSRPASTHAFAFSMRTTQASFAPRRSKRLSSSSAATGTRTG